MPSTRIQLPNDSTAFEQLPVPNDPHAIATLSFLHLHVLFRTIGFYHSRKMMANNDGSCLLGVTQEHEANAPNQGEGACAPDRQGCGGVRPRGPALGRALCAPPEHKVRGLVLCTGYCHRVVEVFSFLWVGQSVSNLTSLDLSLRMEHQATSNHSTSIWEMAQNYKMVKVALQGN